MVSPCQPSAGFAQRPHPALPSAAALLARRGQYGQGHGRRHAWPGTHTHGWGHTHRDGGTHTCPEAHTWPETHTSRGTHRDGDTHMSRGTHVAGDTHRDGGTDVAGDTRGVPGPSQRVPGGSSPGRGAVAAQRSRPGPCASIAALQPRAGFDPCNRGDLSLSLSCAFKETPLFILLLLLFIITKSF